MSEVGAYIERVRVVVHFMLGFLCLVHRSVAFCNEVRGFAGRLSRRLVAGLQLSCQALGFREFLCTRICTRAWGVRGGLTWCVS